MNGNRFILLIVTLVFTACTTLPPVPQPVTLVADGQRNTYETEAETVQELLTEVGINLNELDRLSLPENAALRQGMTITITRVIQSTEVETETIAFGRQIVRNAALPEGESRLLESGRPGVLERVFRITEEDGVVVERILIREAIAEPPQDEVMLIGTQRKVQTTAITGTLAYLHNQDAWLMRDTSRSQRQMTSSGDLDGRVLALSPDTEYLLFTRAVTEEDKINTLWLVSTSEADPTPVSLDLDNVLWADWASDGQRLAWTTAETMERAPGWRGQNDLWVGRLTSRQTLVSRQEILKPEAGGGYGWWGTRYAWAPTDTMLSYSQPDEVGVVDLRQRKRVPLAHFAAYRTYGSWAWNPAITWSPRGDFIATILHSESSNDLSAEDSPIFNLWMLEATGAYSAELVIEVGMWATPRFNVDGETLLFGRASIPYQSEVSTYSLCLIDRDGSDQHCLAPTVTEPQVEIPEWYWSPDNKTIAFIQQDDIYLLSIEDNTIIPITNEGGITALTWR